MTCAYTGIKEVLDVILNSTVLVYQLLMVPDRTINLSRAVELRTPRTVLNIGLLSVPSLSELVLHLRQSANLAPLHTSVVGNLEVALAVLLTTLCCNHDNTV